MAHDERSAPCFRDTARSRARRLACRSAAVRIRRPVRQVVAAAAGDDRVRPRRCRQHGARAVASAYRPGAARRRGRLDWKLGGLRRAARACTGSPSFGRSRPPVSPSDCSASRAFPCSCCLLEALLRQRRLRGREWAIAALVSGGLLLVVPELRWENRVVQGLAWGTRFGPDLCVARRCQPCARGAARSGHHRACGKTPALRSACCRSSPLRPWSRTRGRVLLLVVLGVACTALAHTLFVRSLRVLSAHTASVVTALEPVYGIVLAFLLLGETPSARTLCGAALIVAAAICATRSRSP